MRGTSSPLRLSVSTTSIAILVLVLPAAANAATYHVAPGGKDGGAGSEAAPWATLQHAADSVGPGDTVIVHAGSYVGFQLETSGEAGAPITFSAEEGVIVDTDNPMTPHGINLEGASFVVVEGFQVRRATRAGLRAVLCEHVTFRGNHSHDNGYWGILTGFCDDVLIEDNECTASAVEHGIYVSNSGDRPVIRGNRIHDNAANGIHMNGDVSMGGDGIISNALVERNVIWHNGNSGGSGINCDGVQDSRIQNNLLYGNHASGISLYRIDGGGPSTGNVVVNNTVFSSQFSRWCLNITNGSTGNTAFNNVFYTNHDFRGSIVVAEDAMDGFRSDYNVVMDRLSPDGDATILSLDEWQADTGQDRNSLVATPADLFIDVDTVDFHHAADSPAIDSGTEEEAPAIDLDGNTRPNGEGTDIGAYEVPGGGNADADTDVDTDADTDADTDGTAKDDGGCGCRAAGTTRAPLLGLAIPLLFASGRRKEERRP